MAKPKVKPIKTLAEEYREIQKKDPKEKKARGRPSTYDQNIGLEVCSRLSDGETLRQICRDAHMPPRTTILNWVIDDREGFSDRYARARDLCLESWADEIVEIGDDASNDWMVRSGKEGESTGWALNGEHVNRSRLRVENRKWLLSKLKPERYGDKLELGGKVTHSHEAALEQLK